MSLPPASRQGRRQERRRILKLGRAALTRGFSQDLDDEVTVGVLLMLADKLAETANPARAGEAAEIAEQVLERSNAVYERQPDVACKRGCWHCCVTVASVTPPEIFRVAAWLRRNRMNSPDMSPAAVIARCEAKVGPSIEAMFAQKVPCPALVDGECGVHPSRPINCRQFLSTSLPACLKSFGGADTEVPFITAATDRGTLARLLLTGAMKAAGFPDTGYELAGALAAALRDECSEQRWLAGEDVFAGVLVTPRPASTQGMVDHCAELVRRNA
jgi:hypothetical protein